jgi:transposase InsO family protein
MGWREVSVADQRREFVMLASLAGANISALCERFGISRQTGHLWLRRFAAGEHDFADRSRRPLHSPHRLSDELEEMILAVRDAHPAWGARKIAEVLRRDGIAPPADSTVHAVLSRHCRIAPESAGRAYGTFERSEPNALWQMDFKGQVRLGCGAWLHPLTVIDDHSRFAVGLAACANQQTQTVQARLETTFRHHGLPEEIYVDNGSPWGGGRPGQWTPLRVWLLKLGIKTIHSRPYHPQGRGKNERFHRSLKAEVFSLAPLSGLRMRKPPSIAGAMSITASDRIRRSTSRRLPSATGPRCELSPQPCQFPPTRQARSCAASARPRLTCPSAIGSGKSRRPSQAKSSPSGLASQTAGLPSASALTRSHHSISIVPKIPKQCKGCPRTLSGMSPGFTTSPGMTESAATAPESGSAPPTAPWSAPPRCISDRPRPSRWYRAR